MNADVERLVHEGLDRLTAGAEVPAGLVTRARRRIRRTRLLAGSALATGTAAVTAVAVFVAGGAAPGGQASTGTGHIQTAAYVVLRHVDRAVIAENRVMRALSISWGTTDKADKTPSTTWSYRDASNWVEYTGNGCGHALRNGWCTHRGGSEPFVASGTAEIGGRLRSAYVAYYQRTWSGGGRLTPPAPACSKTARLGMGGPAPDVQDWPAFIGTALGCSAARVTGRASVNGVDTIKITGTPVRTRLPKGMVQATEATVRYTLYVNPRTYLPVRMYGATISYGGGANRYTYATVTDFGWLPPTAANVARAIITIPSGFRHVNSPGGP